MSRACCDCGGVIQARYARCPDCRKTFLQNRARIAAEQRVERRGYTRSFRCRLCKKALIFAGPCYRCATGREPTIVPVFERERVA